MKHLIKAVLDDHVVTEEILTTLSKAGFNGTVIPSTSLKHTLENGGEIPMFMNLAHFESDRFENNTTLEIIVEENKVEEVCSIIREKTKGFTACKGGMFVIPLPKFEGSF